MWGAIPSADHQLTSTTTHTSHPHRQVTPTGAQIQTGQPGTSQTPADAVAPSAAAAAEAAEEADPDKRPEGELTGVKCLWGWVVVGVGGGGDLWFVTD